MAEQNAEPVTTDVESNYTATSNDPKNMQEVTQYVSFYEVFIANTIYTQYFFQLF